MTGGAAGQGDDTGLGGRKITAVRGHWQTP